MGNLSTRRNKEFKILMAGLDQAGKTTALYFLKYGESSVPTGPTISFNVETVNHQGHDFVIWDVSGKDKIRKMWRHYFKSTDGIIFVIDSTDFGEERIEECKEALSLLMDEDLLKGCIILVLANKQDLPDAVPSEEIREKLELDLIQDRKWHIEDTCATTGEGLFEGLDWLSSTLITQRQP